MKKVISILMLPVLLLSMQTKGQATIDSLNGVLAATKTDSDRVKAYLALGDAAEQQNNDLVGAKKYYALAGQLSRQSKYTIGTIEYLFDYSDALVQQGDYDSSLSMNQEAEALAIKIKDSQRLVRAHFNIGVSNSGLCNFSEAIRYFLLAADYYERTGQKAKVGMCDNELMILFRQTQNYTKAIEYGQNAISIYRKYRTEDKVAIPLVNLAVVYQSMQQPKKAEPLLKEALTIDKKHHKEYGELNDLINLVDLQNHLNLKAETKPYSDRILLLGRKMQDNESICDGYLNLALYYMFRNQLVKARLYADSAISLAGTTSISELKQSCYVVMSHIAYAAHRYKEAMEYDEKTDLTQQAIVNTNINSKVLELQTKYETTKKTAKIKQLQAQETLQQLSIDRKRNYLLVMTLVIMALLVIGFLYYRNYKRKQKLLITEKKLQQQQISSLEQEKVLMATEAVMQGQEEERSRLAKDLHDGLGGILSGAKYSLNTLKENMVITPDNAAAFERTVEILDKSIFELRRVAHNMMPESLVGQKLRDALRDFCTLITASGALTIEYHDVGMEHVEIESTKKVTIYRIIQELVNNIIKHASAKKAIVQLICKQQVLSITVEDDGVGFDPGSLSAAGGIGYKNIFNRIDYLKAKMDIDSNPKASKGTSVYIEMPI
ncbi:tetratricopeptide repeat-containing sensor histidine kinase [Arachidicoccus ginsenosidivorans]|nr:tetratricopeptide repeat-containing sensor histidine kinase [Arachidicoccus ginsenosidivorans]